MADISSRIEKDKNDLNQYHFSAIGVGRLFFFLMFVASFLFLMLFLNHHMSNLLNADDSSELILSKLLASENGILTNKWYYSTELRVLNTQLVYSFFFKVFNNWHVVRMVSLFCMLSIMLGACFFMCRQLQLEKCFWVAATVLVLPFSEDYFNIVLKGAYYIPHITISFVYVGLLELQSRGSGKKRNGSIVLAFVLALLAGLGGPRQIIIIYIPAFLAGTYFFISEGVKNCGCEQEDIVTCIKKIPTECLCYEIMVTVSFVGSLIGYLINSNLFSRIYDFRYFDVSFAEFDISRLASVLQGFFVEAGYTNGEVLSVRLIYNFVSFVWTILTCGALMYAMRNRKCVSPVYFRFSILTFFSYIFLILLYSFSNLKYMHRYCLPGAVFSIPCILFFVKEIGLKDKYRYLFGGLLLFLVIVRSSCYYNDIHKVDDTQELRNIIECLTQKGYQEGYASFWNANILTELSNGAVEVWDWGDRISDFNCIDQTYEWLQVKNHVYEHPEGKVFWILSESENNSVHYVKGITSGHLLYMTPEDINWDVFDDSKKINRYYVYGFSSYEEMYSLVGTYDFEGERVIGSGQKLSTDNRTLYPDEYTIIVSGENLTECEMDLTYNPVVKYKKKKKVWSRPHDLEIGSITGGKDYKVITFDVDEVISNFQINMTNNGVDEANVTDIRIIKDDIYYADFYSSEWLKAGTDNDGKRTLEPGGASFGPYIMLVPGTYVVECEGDGIDGLTYDATYLSEGQPVQIETELIEQSKDHLVYEVSLESALQNVEIRLFNNSDRAIEIEGLHVQRKRY